MKHFREIIERNEVSQFNKTAKDVILEYLDTIEFKEKFCILDIEGIYLNNTVELTYLDIEGSLNILFEDASESLKKYVNKYPESAIKVVQDKVFNVRLTEGEFFIDEIDCFMNDLIIKLKIDSYNYIKALDVLTPEFKIIEAKIIRK